MQMCALATVLSRQYGRARVRIYFAHFAKCILHGTHTHTRHYRREVVKFKVCNTAGTCPRTRECALRICVTVLRELYASHRTKRSTCAQHCRVVVVVINRPRCAHLVLAYIISSPAAWHRVRLRANSARMACGCWGNRSAQKIFQ